MESKAEREPDSAVPAPQPRSLLARLGIVVLNLISPGLGVIRVGRLRPGLWLLFGDALLYLFVGVVAAMAPTASITGAVVVVALTLMAWVLIYLGAIVLGWRWSRLRETTRWWSRWYALIALYLVSIAATIIPVQIIHHRLYKPFYIPSEAMLPTLVKWDRILVDMSDRTPRRGEVIIFRTRGYDYINRVAALGGDTIEMRNGVPVINGVTVDQRPAGTMRITSDLGGIARRLSEQLPGERGRHYVLDFGDSDFDNTPLVKVPTGSIFVLGDNRDRTADSRVPPEMDGAGIVPLTAVRGRALFITYSTADWSRSGTRINP